MWHLWIQDKALELMDPLLGDSYPINEAKKYIKIGLLCAQENTEERPTMSMVVHMFRSNDETVFPEPSQPPTFMKHRDGSTFFNDNKVDGSSSSINFQSLGFHSINDITISEIEAR